MADGRILEMCLETEGELQQPGPLVLHGRHVRLDHLASGVVADDQTLSTVQHRAELRFALLEIRHQTLQKRKSIKNFETKYYTKTILLYLDQKKKLSLKIRDLTG